MDTRYEHCDLYRSKVTCLKFTDNSTDKTDGHIRNNMPLMGSTHSDPWTLCLQAHHDHVDPRTFQPKAVSTPEENTFT